MAFHLWFDQLTIGSGPHLTGHHWLFSDNWGGRPDRSALPLYCVVGRVPFTLAAGRCRSGATSPCGWREGGKAAIWAHLADRTALRKWKTRIVFAVTSPLQPVTSKLELEVRTVSTHSLDLKLTSWRITTLPESGSIVVLGQEFTPHATTEVFQYKLEGGRLQKLSQMRPCRHVPDDILGVMVEGQELLAVACGECENIALVNLETREVTEALFMEKTHRLCHGEEDRIWVYCRTDNHTVRELNCSSKRFTETGRTVSTAHHCSDMCYLPHPHRALVLSQNKLMEAVSCETRQQLWTLDRGFYAVLIRVTFHSDLQLLVVVEYRSSRQDGILVVDPRTGEPLHTFPYHSPRGICWSHGRLLLHRARSSLASHWISHLELLDSHTGGSPCPNLGTNLPKEKVACAVNWNIESWPTCTFANLASFLQTYSIQNNWRFQCKFQCVFFGFLFLHSKGVVGTSVCGSLPSRCSAELPSQNQHHWPQRSWEEQPHQEAAGTEVPQGPGEHRWN